MSKDQNRGTGRTGRNLSLCDDVIDAIVEALTRKTAYIGPACAHARVSKRSYHHWRARGEEVLAALEGEGVEEPDEILLTLELRAAAAAGRAEEARHGEDAKAAALAARHAERDRLCARLVVDVKEAHEKRSLALSSVVFEEALVRKNYVAAKELLARTERDRYGAGSNVKVSGDPEAPVSVGIDLSGVPLEAIDRILAVTSDLAGGDDDDLDDEDLDA